MSSTATRPTETFRRLRLFLVAVVTLGMVMFVFGLVTVTGASKAYAAVTPIDLGTAETFSVLGSASVSNTGPSTLDGDLGVDPGDKTKITGFDEATVGGKTYAPPEDDEAGAAQAEASDAYDDAEGRASEPENRFDGSPVELGNKSLVGGVYKTNSAAGLTGPLTLNGGAEPGSVSDSVWIFQIGSTLITEVGSSVNLIGGAQACNVFWQVGSSATLGVDSKFVGTVVARASVTANTGATIDGRLIALDASVTLDTNTFRSSECDRSDSSESASPTVVDTQPEETGPATGNENDNSGDNGNSGDNDNSNDNDTKTATSTSTAVTGLADTGAGTGTTSVALGGLALLLGGAFLLSLRRKPRHPGRHE